MLFHFAGAGSPLIAAIILIANTTRPMPIRNIVSIDGGDAG
jgi:hypothetical protein